jgi:hypothetical protein
VVAVAVQEAFFLPEQTVGLVGQVGLEQVQVYL